MRIIKHSNEMTDIKRLNNGYSNNGIMNCETTHSAND